MSPITGNGAPKAYEPLDPDQRLRIGVVGGDFGASFPWTKHPNCAVTAIAARREDRRGRMVDALQCGNAYSDFHALLRDPKVDAVAIFTGVPSHAEYSVDAMNAGKHVICAVPASITLEGCQQLVDTVKKTGLIYMNAETGCFRQPTMAAYALNKAGKLGTIYHSEGAYYHDLGTFLASGRLSQQVMDWLIYEGKPTWRLGMVPGYYSTHATGPVVHVTGEKLAEVTAVGMPIDHPWYKSNQYNNPFICETMFFRTSGGHSARISLHFWSREPFREGADYCGTEASFYEPWMGRPTLVSSRPAEETDVDTAEVYALPDYGVTLPPSLRDSLAIGHGGAEAFIVHEFVSACLEQRKPVVDVYKAVAFAAPGICGHQSAMKEGELTKVPDFGPIS